MRKIVWIILFSLISAGIITILHQTIPTYIDLPLAITLVVVEVPIGLLLHFITKEKKQDSTTIQRVISESSADKREDLDHYVNHLKKDIMEVLESKGLPYFESLKNEKDGKKMILQHMYTYDSVGGEPVHRNYYNIWHLDNNVQRSGYEVGKLLRRLKGESQDICRNISDLTYNGEIKQAELLQIFGFPPNVTFSDIQYDLHNVKAISEHNFTENHFYVEQDYEDKLKYYVKYDRTIVAFSNTRKNAEKLLKSILLHTSEIVKLITAIEYEKTERSANKMALEEGMTHLHKSLENGKPNFGVCDGCLAFFPHSNKEQYEYLLSRFNTNLLNWVGETIW